LIILKKCLLFWILAFLFNMNFISCKKDESHISYEELFDIYDILDSTEIGEQSIQGSAIYGNYLIQFFNRGYLAIIDLENETLIKKLLVPNTSSGYHANNVNFSNYWIDGNTDFPLLYVSECYGSHRVFVYSLSYEGITLIQTISFNGSGYESSNRYDWFLDNENDLIYTLGNTENHDTADSNKILITCFKLPSPEEGDVILNNEDVIDSFYNNDIYIYQGSFVISSKVYCLFGIINPIGYTIIDLINQKTTLIVNMESDFKDEPEGISRDNEGLVIVFYTGKVRRFKY